MEYIFHIGLPNTCTLHTWKFYTILNAINEFQNLSAIRQNTYVTDTGMGIQIFNSLASNMFKLHLTFGDLKGGLFKHI